jgi:cytochrome c peroxidase
MQKYFSKIVFSLFVALFAGMILLSSFDKKSGSKLQNIQTEEQLGKALFFDSILSKDRTVSCASCHKPEFAFADTSAFSKGIGGKLGVRNTPSVMNMSGRGELFWDGRAKDLEDQVKFPIENPVEMNLPYDSAVARLKSDKHYEALFKKIYGAKPNHTNLAQAIAAFERTLETEDTPNDRWLNDEAESGMTAQMIRGRELFTSDRTRCFDCHFTPDFTADEYRNIGLFDGKALNDSGRYVVTKNPKDLGTFKTPGLRNVAITAPYMHDGSFKTLREVIDYYDEPAKFMIGSINRDTILPKKIGLTENEKQDLEAFLHSLTDDRFKK